MDGIFGSVNPRVTDDWYAILFPAGFLSILVNVAMLGVATLVHGLATWLARARGIDRRPAREAWGLAGIAWSLGILITPAAVAFALLLIVASGRHLVAAFRDLSAGREARHARLHRVNATLLATLWWILLAAFFALPVGIFFLFSGYPFAFYLGSYVASSALVVAGHLVRRAGSRRAPPIPSRRARTGARAAAVAAIAAFSIVFVGSALVRVHPPAPGAPTSSEPTTLTLVSYNIRLGVAREANPANNWENRKTHLAAYIASLAPDIMGVQEAYHFQLEYLRASFNGAYSYTGFGREDGIHGGEHAAIFFNNSRFRFVDGDTFWLADFPDLPVKTWGNAIIRVCTWARFEVVATGAQLVVFNTHYDVSSQYEVFHEKASRLIKDRVDAHAGGLPVFVMGDFNMNNKTTAFELLLHHGGRPLNDTYTGPETFSFNGWDAFKTGTCCRIDFILASPGVEVLSASVPKDSYGGGVVYSDHYPAVATCRF